MECVRLTLLLLLRVFVGMMEVAINAAYVKNAEIISCPFFCCGGDNNRLSKNTRVDTGA
jgi:hypothetical protein